MPVHPIREAELYARLPDGRVRCDLCAHRCVLEDRGTGLCGVRFARDEKLWTSVYGIAAAMAVDPIEKKPFRHFLPGTRTLSLATVGCNFACGFCQNHDLSQFAAGRSGDDPPGEAVAPEEVVARAREANVESVCFTYSEPTIFFEYARDVARAARAAGLKVLLKTNGFMTEEALDGLEGLVDAANVDLKAFDDGAYARLANGRLQPVLDAIASLRRRGIWVEATTVLIPGENDGEESVEGMAAFLASLDRSIPWHLGRFHPDYRMLDHPPTPLSTLLRAWEAGRAAGLRHVYVGLPGNDTEHTVCPGCAEVVITRFGYRTLRNRLVAGRCPACATALAGVWT